MDRQSQIRLMQDLGGACGMFGLATAFISVFFAYEGFFRTGLIFCGITAVLMILWNVLTEIANNRIDSEKRKKRKRQF